MNRYEAMFIVDPRHFPKGTEEAMSFVKGMLEKHGCQVLESGRWDERKLCYPIKKQKKGIYFLFFFEAETAAIATIERECVLTEQVLRVLFLRLEGEIPKDVFKKVSETPSGKHTGDHSEVVIPELEIEGAGALDWEEVK